MSLITAVFCSFCQEPYASTRRPRTGNCGHIICETCQGNKPKCRICGVQDTFNSNVDNYQAIGILDGVEQKAVEGILEQREQNMNETTIGRCSIPSCCSPNSLRFCVTCGEKDKLLQELSAANKMWIDNVRSMEKHLFCADCILDTNHDRSHEIVMASDVPALTKHLDLWNLLIPARLLEKKIEEKENTGDMAKLSDFIDSYTLEAIEYSVFKRIDNLKRIETQIKDNFLVDVNQLPELAAAKEMVFQKAKSVHLENLKLKERRLIYLKEEIDLHNQLVLEKYNAAKDKKPWELIRKEFDVVVKKFAKISVLRNNERLDEAEIEEIDRKVEERMEEMIALAKENELSSEDVDENFLKFRVIKSELTKLNHEIEEAEQKLLENYEKLRKFSLRRLETLNACRRDAERWTGSKYEELSCSSSFNKILLYEVTDRSLRNDKILIEYLELIHQYHLTNLTFSKHFKSIPGRSYEDDIYIRLIESCNTETKSFMRKALHATAFS